jgi:hypothetical protein
MTNSMTLYLNVYEIDRCYGGPEEGGWYYDSGDFIKCIGRFPDTKKGRKAAEAQREAFNTEEGDPRNYKMGHGSHDGVDDNGEPDDRYLIPGGAWGYGQIKALIENHEGISYPETRPHYC